jgi:hypothetical protein
MRQRGIGEHREEEEEEEETRSFGVCEREIGREGRQGDAYRTTVEESGCVSDGSRRIRSNSNFLFFFCR